MDNILEFLKPVGVLLMVITTAAYLYQVVYLFLPLLMKEKPLKSGRQRRYAILIAARNEENVLPHLLRSIAGQDYPENLRDVYVVADNCTDGTAKVAAAHGATVIERFNKEKVGKGYALNYLLSKIDKARYDAFLVFDADNLLSSDYITNIDRVCTAGYEAFCGYRNSKNFGDNWVSSGHALWYLHESTHLNRSRMLLGTSCAVSGTGFGFTRELLEKCGGWNYFTLTEDIEFSTWCASHGVRIGYCHDAVLYDEQPTRLSQSVRQRTRWTQGGLQVSIRYAGDLLRGLFKGGRTAYASFETATLSLWGYGMAAISFGTTLLLTYLTERWLGIAQSLAFSLLGTYVSMFAVGVLTLLTEGKRIRATGKQKIISAFTFPLYMITYIPIAVTAPFRKFNWAPISHTVAISTEELHSQSKFKI